MSSIGPEDNKKDLSDLMTDVLQELGKLSKVLRAEEEKRQKLLDKIVSSKSIRDIFPRSTIELVEEKAWLHGVDIADDTHFLNYLEHCVHDISLDNLFSDEGLEFSQGIEYLKQRIQQEGSFEALKLSLQNEHDQQVEEDASLIGDTVDFFSDGLEFLAKTRKSIAFRKIFVGIYEGIEEHVLVASIPSFVPSELLVSVSEKILAAPLSSIEILKELMSGFFWSHETIAFTDALVADLSVESETDVNYSDLARTLYYESQDSCPFSIEDHQPLSLTEQKIVYSLLIDGLNPGDGDLLLENLSDVAQETIIQEIDQMLIKCSRIALDSDKDTSGVKPQVFVDEVYEQFDDPELIDQLNQMESRILSELDENSNHMELGRKLSKREISLENAYSECVEEFLSKLEKDKLQTLLAALFLTASIRQSEPISVLEAKSQATYVVSKLSSNN